MIAPVAVFIGKGDGDHQSNKAATQSLLMPKRFVEAKLAPGQRRMQHAEEAAGLHPSTPTSSTKATTQSLLMPHRFRGPATESQQVVAEVSRAVGGHSEAQRPTSIAEAMQEEKALARRMSSHAREQRVHQAQTLNAADHAARRPHAHSAATVSGLLVAAPARTEQLSTQYLDFGKKARSFYLKHGLMTEKEAQWADKLATGWEKAPVTMLAQTAGGPACGRGGPCPAVPEFNLKHGITSAAEEKWARSMGVESAADKAVRTTQLSFSDTFDPQVIPCSASG